MRYLFLRAPALLLAGCLIVLSAVNTTPVPIRIPGVSALVELPVYLVFLSGLVLGVMLAALVSLPQRWRSWRRARRAELRAARLQHRSGGEAGSAAAPDLTASRSLAAVDRAQRPSRI